MIHKYLSYGAYGWLAFGAAMHFIIDVVSQKLRGVRAPSPETTLYYGLNSSYALGQLALGAVGLWLMLRAPELVREVPMMVVSLLAGLAWLAVTFLFMEYREPRFVSSIFLVLMLASVATSRA